MKNMAIKYKKSALCFNIFISTFVGSCAGLLMQQVSYGIAVSLMLNITISTLLTKNKA